MKIVYAENPLRTQVLLDDHEKKEFWYKIKIEELQERMISAYFHVEDEKDFYDPKRAKQELDPEYFYVTWKDSSKKGEKSGIDKRVDELFAYYIDDLENNPHVGDCTCVACSCSKCHAESLLGIDTMPGLGKHEASKIGGAFDRYDMTEKKWYTYVRTLDEVVAYLENDCANFEERMKSNPPDWKGWEAHIPRWKQEGINAYNWLKKYREDHFSG